MFHDETPPGAYLGILGVSLTRSLVCLRIFSFQVLFAFISFGSTLRFVMALVGLAGIRHGFSQLPQSNRLLHAKLATEPTVEEQSSAVEPAGHDSFVNIHLLPAGLQHNPSGTLQTNAGRGACR